MARNAKNGVPFISLDCNFFDKPKMFRVEEEFGEIGMARALRLMMYIYSTEGCWLEWGDGSAYYFAKKVLGNAGAAEEIERLVRFLVEIGFFVQIEGTEGDEIGRVYLTSAEIFTDWMKIQKLAKRKCDINRIPKCIKVAATAPLVKTNQSNIPSEEKAITSEEKAITSECMLQKRVYKKEKKKEIIPEGINSQSEENNPGQPASQDPALLVRGARDDPHWEEVRLRVSREIYSQYLSADLVDAITALAVLRWITPAQLKDWFRKARDETELYRNSKGHAGKAMKWEVLRPLAEDVYLAHSLTLPPCDSRRREPPPEPERTRSADVGYDAATRAGRAVMAMT